MDRVRSTWQSALLYFGLVREPPERREVRLRTPPPNWRSIAVGFTVGVVVGTLVIGVLKTVFSGGPLTFARVIRDGLPFMAILAAVYIAAVVADRRARSRGRRSAEP